MILLATSLSGVAQDVRQQPPGWLWYEDPAAEAAAPDIVVQIPPAAASAPAPPKAWTTERIRKTLPRLQDLAVEDPTPENVKAYLALKRVVMNRAQRFAEVSMMVTQADAHLDENARFPLATAAAQAHVASVQTGLVSAVQEIGQNAGLFFFFRSDCPYCHQDLGVLRTLQLTTGMKVTCISLDGSGIDDQMCPNYLIDNGQGMRLGVSATPAFFLVRPPDLNNVVELGQGFLSLDELEKRIVEQSYYRRWVNTEIYEKSRLAKPMYTNGEGGGSDGDLQPGEATLIEAAVRRLPPETPGTAEPAVASQNQ